MKEEIKLFSFRLFPKTMTKIYFRKFFKKKLNLRNPKLYSEKIQWLKFYYENDEKAILAGDKVGLHKYLKEKELGFLLVPLYNYYNNVDEIVWEELPNQFVIKKSNASGMNIIVSDKSTIDVSDVKEQMNRWMSQEYGIFGAEKHYAKMDSKIIIEHFLEDIDKDWRIFFLNGEPEMIQISHWEESQEQNYSGHKKSIRTFMDIDGRIRAVIPDEGVINIDFKVGDYIKLPTDFAKMLEYGKIIANDFPLVRVDYFHVKNKLYIGELTFTPGNGYQVLTEKLQIDLGEKLILPRGDLL